MKVGNKVHAIGLSLILVGAIGYIMLQFRARAMARSVQPIPSSAVSRADDPQATSQMLPQRVYGDPFTHVKLPRTKPAAVAYNAQSTPGPGLTPPQELGGKLGYSPVFMPRDGHGSSFGDLAVSEGIDRGAGAGGRLSGPVPGPTSSGPVGPVLCLCGVVAAPTPIAFISFDGKQPRGFGLGKTVMGRITVLRIREGEIDLRLPNGTKRLPVGAKLQL